MAQELEKKDLYGVCPYVTAQKLLAGKWSIIILHHLSEGPIRFNELLRRLPQMTHATLSKQLKALEEHKLLIRTEYPRIPPRVEYSLSPMGERFKLVLDSLETWGDEYIAYIESREERQPEPHLQ
jgi:DNA-binding HxlR family transcriptional regulator